MKVISIFNLKGGVGKTTTAYNMAYELEKRGYSVLAIDNDKQGNLSKAFEVYDNNTICGTAKMLMNKDEYINTSDFMKTTHHPHIYIINANMSLLSATYNITGEEAAGQNEKYKKIINQSISEYVPEKALKNCFDYCIIDNPPDIALNVVNALTITDEVIIPLTMDEWGLEGLDIVVEQIEEVKKYLNKNIKILGAIVTKYKNNDSNIAGLEWLKNKRNIPVLAKIRYTEKAAESTFFQKPIYEYSSRCGAAQDYKNFIKQYLKEK